ncbi:Protein FAM187B [Vulpes lagopus]
MKWRLEKLEVCAPCPLVWGGALSCMPTVPPAAGTLWEGAPHPLFPREQGAAVSTSFLPGAAAAHLVLLCRPILWEANDMPLTWQGQLSNQDLNTVLEPANGGRQLRVFQPAIYKCFVQQELMARFNPRPFPDVPEALREEEAGRQQGAREASKGKAGPVLKGLKLTLLVGIVLGLLGLLGLLLKFFHHSQGKRSDQVLLVK